MKCLLMVYFLTIMFYTSYSQSNAKVYRTFKSDTAGDWNLKSQNKYAPGPGGEAGLPGENALPDDNTESGKKFLSGFDIPGYYQPGEMMSTTGLSSTLGRVKFSCDYYYDAEGQLQGGQIIISKIK